MDNISYEESKEKISFIPLPNKSRPCVLLAEDNPDLRKYIVALLAEYFEIKEAENGIIALQILEHTESKIDLILSDIMMPEMDGVSLLDTLRKRDQYKTIPFIFLTAKHNEEDIINAYKMGVDDYIKKPFDEEELLYRINAVYQNYKVRVQSAQELEIIDKQDTIDKEDDAFVMAFKQLVIDNLSAPDFSMDMLAEKLETSKRTLQRSIKKEIGTTPGDFIKEIKLNVARKYIESMQYQDLDEILDKVRFTDKRYFKKIYFERFGTRL